MVTIFWRIVSVSDILLPLAKCKSESDVSQGGEVRFGITQSYFHTDRDLFPHFSAIMAVRASVNALSLSMGTLST